SYSRYVTVIYKLTSFNNITQLNHKNFTLYFHFFLFNNPATTVIYTLSLHDALPIWVRADTVVAILTLGSPRRLLLRPNGGGLPRDRKSTRLNSSHVKISYAVFCLKKKKAA